MASVIGASEPDPWNRALNAAISQLPPQSQTWLRQQSSTALLDFTQLVQSIQPLAKRYSENWFQKCMRKITPIASHIDSFACVISTFVQCNPNVGSLIWGSVYLFIKVAIRSERYMEKSLDLLSKLTPDLVLFQSWLKLFPEKDFTNLGLEIQATYLEVIYFCVNSIIYLRHHPIVNAIRTLIRPNLEQTYNKHSDAIKYHTTRVRDEVSSAHMHSMQQNLANLEMKIQSIPSNRPLVTPSSIKLIPYPRNPRFFGRDQTLNQLSEYFQPLCHQGEGKAFTICGLGGSGKTQIALEYAFRNIQSYRAVIWIQADSLEKMERSFHECAILLGLGERPSLAREAKLFVLSWLASLNGDYLLIFDNADKMELLRDFWPNVRPGRLLVTSRDTVASMEITVEGVEVEKFSADDSCLFLRSLLSPSLCQESNDDILTICSMFDGLPLAIAHVAGFIRTRGCSLGEFLRIHISNSQSTAATTTPLHGYSKTLDTVWDLSFALLGNEARRLLEVLTHFDPDGIPYDLLFTPDTSIEEQIDRRNRLSFLNSLQELRAQSLVQLNGQRNQITIHRYFRNCVLWNLSVDQPKALSRFDEALSLIWERRPGPQTPKQWNVQNWEIMESYMPHIRRLEAHVLKNPFLLQGQEDRMSTILFRVALNLCEQGRYYTSLDTIMVAIQIGSNSHGKTPSDLPLFYNLEARMCNNINQPERGILAARKALALLERAVATSSISTSDIAFVRIWNNLGNALNQLQQFDEGLQLFNQSIYILQGHLPEYTQMLSIIYLNRGSLYSRMDKINDAESDFRHVLDDLHPESPDTRVAYGKLCHEQGRLDEAFTLYSEAYEIAIRDLGKNHEFVALCEFKLGEILLDTNQISQAVIFFRRSLKGFERLREYMDSRGQRARLLRKLSEALKRLGEHSESKIHQTKSWELFEQLSGKTANSETSDADFDNLVFFFNY